MERIRIRELNRNELSVVTSDCGWNSKEKNQKGQELFSWGHFPHENDARVDASASSRDLSLYWAFPLIKKSQGG